MSDTNTKLADDQAQLAAARAQVRQAADRYKADLIEAGSKNGSASEKEAQKEGATFRLKAR